MRGLVEMLQQKWYWFVYDRKIELVDYLRGTWLGKEIIYRHQVHELIKQKCWPELKTVRGGKS